MSNVRWLFGPRFGSVSWRFEGGPRVSRKGADTICQCASMTCTVIELPRYGRVKAKH